MNKYELALVVSAKIEDDARTATVEKAKEYITRVGGIDKNCSACCRRAYAKLASTADSGCRFGICACQRYAR